jgi:hypothetical protein
MVVSVEGSATRRYARYEARLRDLTKFDDEAKVLVKGAAETFEEDDVFFSGHITRGGIGVVWDAIPMVLGVAEIDLAHRYVRAASDFGHLVLRLAGRML